MININSVTNVFKTMDAERKENMLQVLFLIKMLIKVQCLQSINFLSLKVSHQLGQIKIMKMLLKRQEHYMAQKLQMKLKLML